MYLAEDTKLKRRVALKVLRPNPGHDVEAKLAVRFRREAESLAKLSHRHIVGVFDFGVIPKDNEDDHYYLAMEYIDGDPLSRILREQRVSLKRGLRLVLQVAKALRYVVNGAM